jgi:predicted RNA-binding protein YlqC (UPF0109 family)
MQSMRALLEYIAQHLVDTPDAVTIKERVGRFTVTYALSVSSDETGKVIGRSGRVAKAIRDLMGVAAARQNKRVHLDIE